MQTLSTETVYDFQTYSTFSEVEHIWRTLELQSESSLFQSFDWQKTYFESIAKPAGDKLRIVLVVDKDKQAVMLLPLVVTRIQGIRVLMFNGGVLSDYCMPVINQNIDYNIVDFKQFWSGLKKSVANYDAVYLINQPQHIGNIKNPLSPKFFRSAIGSHALTLDQPWQDLYSSRISKKIRADTRRQRKRIAEFGEVKYVVAETEEQRSVIIQKMIEQKQLRYQQMQVRDIFSSSGYTQFFQQLHKHWNGPGKVHISALTIENEIVATHWGLHSDNKFYYLMPSYDMANWGRFSVGRILLEELIQWSSDHGLAVFDFSLGDEPYKFAWCDTETELYESVDYVTFFGFVFCSYKKLKQKLKEVYKR